MRPATHGFDQEISAARKFLMPALPSSIIEPIWDQFHSLIPPVVDTHPLGCHRPRVDARIVFDKLIRLFGSVVGVSGTRR